MNKTELIAAIAHRTGMAKTHVTACLDAYTETVCATLEQGGDVKIAGFGAFQVKHRKARTGRNPSTGEELQVPAKVVPAFSFGKPVRDAVAEAHESPRRRR